MKRILSTPAAPQAIGPYSQAVEARGARLLFLSGQIPLDPATGELVAGRRGGADGARDGEPARRPRRGGAGFEHVVRTTIFLADLGDFARVNAVYGRYFPGEPPARATVQVAALPRGARVEIDAVAVLE